MTKIKSFTSLEQSKKLAEILPLESADMCYVCGDIILVSPTKYGDTSIEELYKKHIIPAWSLAALLGVLPTKLQIVLAINDLQGDRKEKYGIGSVEHDKYDCYADNPVDACVAMIENLHELKML